MKITIGRTYPGEAVAVVKCGDVEVEIGYTSLHNLRFAMPPSDSLVWGIAADANNALDALRKEAAKLSHAAFETRLRNKINHPGRAPQDD
jgi:hypothetical protein